MSTPGSYMNSDEPEIASETSVETAINSRCSSDSLIIHWGAYAKNIPVPPEAMHAIERGVQIPRFTTYPLHVALEENPVVLAIPTVDGEDARWLHIESGMQQEAIHLVCAALGLGVCIYNLGVDGKKLTDRLTGTVRMRVESMRPAYGKSYWSTEAPDGLEVDPALPSPERVGRVPLLSAMEDASTSAEGRAAEAKEISQLLWAARGRTPHLHMHKPWGLTVPTWAGGEDYASVKLSTEDGLYRYVNVIGKKPAHAIEKIGDEHGKEGIARILLSVNEEHARALWEVGYMLENLILQAVALKIGYEAELTESGAVFTVKIK